MPKTIDKIVAFFAEKPNHTQITFGLVNDLIHWKLTQNPRAKVKSITPEMKIKDFVKIADSLGLEIKMEKNNA